MSKTLKHHSSNALLETVIRFENLTKKFSLQKQKKPSFIAVLGDSKHIFCTFATLRHPNFDAKLHI
jgi:hypothetical protein